LGFAAGEGVEGLAEFEVAEADFDERVEELNDLLVALGVGCGNAMEIFVKADGFGNGEAEDVVDGFSPVMKVEGGVLVAFSLAVGAGDIEVGEELHFDFLEAVAGTAVAATIAGVE
jgi:hypothetical protein